MYNVMELSARLYEPGDEEGLVKLLELCFEGWPRRDLPFSKEDYWKWKYCDNPLGVNFNNRFPFRKLNIQPLQVKQEILELLNILKEMSPKRVLEIGTAKGGTLFLLSRVAAPDPKIISVDIPEGPFGGGYPEWRMPLYKSFARDCQKIHLIRADSHSYDTVQRVEKILAGSKIDFILIDGDHTYEGVKEDFETYSQFVKKNGIVAFHDIVENPFDEVWQDHRFWKEIKQDFRHREIISERNIFDRISGIGVLYLGA